MKNRTVVINLQKRNLDKMLRALELIRDKLSLAPAWKTRGELAKISVVLSVETLRPVPPAVAPRLTALRLTRDLAPANHAPRPAEVLMLHLGRVGRTKLGFEYVLTSLDEGLEGWLGW